MDEEFLEESEAQAVVGDVGPDVVPDQVRGLSSEQVVEKLVQLETSEDTFETKLKELLAMVGSDSTPFLAMKPTREFMFAQTNPFDEFTIEGDYESALLLARMHPAFYSVALTLFQMAIGKLTLTRSREGFQQKILRTVVNVSQNPHMDEKKKRWSIPIFGGRR